MRRSCVRRSAHGDEIDRTRRLPDAVVSLLREHGVLGMAFPPAYGGIGAGLVTTLKVIEEISVADGSTGWCAAIGSGSIGTLPLAESEARAIYKPGAFVCGVGSPSGRAVAEDGGYRITGRWAYASGCLHADWIFVNNVVFDGDKPLTENGLPQLRIAVLPASEVEIIDTWHVSGLRGTGSNDVALDGVFVPSARTAPVSLGSARAVGEEYRIPMFTLFGLALSPVALGIARRAIEELLALAQGKTPLLSASKLREKPVVQHEIARAEAMVQAGRAYLYETVGALQDRAARCEEIDMEMRARVRLAATFATDFAAQATDIAYRLGGGTSNFETSVLQRCMRDVHAVTQHFVIAASNYETVGRVLMGLDPGTPVI